jgi:predicted transcriptional regulator
MNQTTGYIRATEGVNFMSAANVKEEAKRLIEKLPENMTWDDLMHEIYVRQSIEAGLADSKAGKVMDVAEVRAKFGLQP